MDSQGGSDQNDGTTSDTPWKSFEPVNIRSFQPGDQIRLKAGSVWESTTLSPGGSGKEGNPIVLGAYGEGEKPRLAGKAEVGEVLYFYNQEYWEIRDLEITNTAEGFTGKQNDTNGNKLKDVRGVRIAGQDGGELNGFFLHDLYVHDVTGFCAWISGNTSGYPAGIFGKQGWDKSKRTGGIIFEVMEPKTAEPTVFRDITIANNVINNNSFGGIIVKQWKGDDTVGVHWASREEGKNNGANNYACDNWNPHKNIAIRDNYLSQENSDYACNTIYLTSGQDAVVEGNVSKAAGTCGIEMYYADHVVVQNNEVYETRVKAGGADSNAIDPDKASTNILIQNNYIHETGDGILLCGFVFGTAVVLYNVIQDASKRYINPHGDKGVNYVYNNILYNTKETSKNYIPFIESSGGNSSYLNKSGNMHYFYNNIFYNTAKQTSSIGIGEGSSTFYDNNCYYGKGMKAPEQDANAILGNPMFAGSAPDSAGNEMTGPILALDQLRLRPESPLLEGGKAVDVESDPLIFSIDNAAADFAGETIQGQPEVGIYEYQIEAGAGVVNGYVKDQYGNLIAGASVTFKDTEYQAFTDEQGFFAIAGVKPGTYTAVVSKEVYQDGITEGLEVSERSVSRVELLLGESLSSVGTVFGKITNSSGPISGAEVTVTAKEGSYSAVTDGNGCYEITDVPVGTGYTVTASKAGYTTAFAEEIKVLPAASAEVNLVLSKDYANTTYLLAETFGGYETGNFTSSSKGNDTWAVTDLKNSSKASVQIRAEENGNQYLYMSKEGSGELSVYNKNGMNLSGVVTIEARVMRTADSASANQFGMYTYNKSNFTSGTPSKSSSPIATFALSKGNIITHNKKDSSSTVNLQKYELGTWDIIRNVVNLDTNTFDIYINDMNEPVLSNQPLRTQGKNIDKLLFFSSSSNLGDLMVDYIKVCTGPAIDYDDAGISELKVNGKKAEKVSDHVFEINAEPGVKELAVEPTANSIFAEAVTVDGRDAKNGPVVIPVPEDGSRIAVTVVAEDRSTTETFELLVHKEDESGLAYLTSLTADGVILTPEFDFNTMEYRGTAEADVSRVVLHYTTVQDTNDVTVKANGVLQEGNDVPLKTGENVIVIRVESADGTSNAEYTLTITRKEGEISEDAALLRGTVTDGGVPAAGAEVTVKSGEMQITVMTDENGNYSFDQELLPGEVVITVTNGEKWTVTKTITLEGGRVNRFDVTMPEKNALEAMIALAEREAGETEWYTQESIEALKKAIEKAKATAEDERATKEEVAAQITALKKAMDEMSVLESAYVTYGIAVTRKPDKLEYKIGESFDPAGMEVTAYEKASCSNAAVSEASRRERKLGRDEYEVSAEAFDAAGSKSVEVSYSWEDRDGAVTEFTDTFAVTVGEALEEEYCTLSIKLERKPNKTEYEIGDEFDPSGMKVTVHEKASPSNAVRDRVLAEDEYETEHEPFDTAGTKKVTVTYRGENKDGEEEAFTASFTVRVTEVWEAYYTTGIQVKKKPDKIAYKAGEEFDPTGLKVVAIERASASNAARRERVLTEGEYEVEVPSFETAGTKTIRIVYEAADKNGEDKIFRDSFTVKVTAKSSSNGGGSGSSGGASAYKRDDSIVGTWIGGDAQPWRFQKADGTCVINAWAKIKGQWYHFDEEGNMETGWILVQGKWYLLNAEGAMHADDWVLVNGKWYFLNGGGSMKCSAWYFYKDFWYYFGEDGDMFTAKITPDGYAVDGEGHWIS